MEPNETKLSHIYITLFVVVLLAIAITFLGIHQGFEGKVILIEKTK